MTQEEFVKELTDRLNTDLSRKSILSKSDVKLILKSQREIICQQLSSGKKVQIVGLGTFDTKNRKRKSWTNPRTKKNMIVEEGLVPVFRPGNALKNSLK